MLEVAWRHPLHHRAGAFAASGGECFFTARRTRLVSRAIGTGDERWSARVDGPWGHLAIGEDSVFYLEQHSRLVAFDRTTGGRRWTAELGGTQGWLHVHGQRVIVGGWRGYTRISAIDASDGTLRWRHGREGERVHSTRIHAASGTLVVPIVGSPGWVVFLDLDTGEERRRMSIPGGIDAEPEERPTSHAHPDVTAVFPRGEGGITVVRWSRTEPAVVAPDRAVWSTSIVCSRTLAPFLTRDRRLVVVSIEDGATRELGRLGHDRADFLPFAEIDAGTLVVGTSQGWLHAIAPATEGRLRVGKGIETRLAVSDRVVALGTASGDVLGVRVHE